MTSESLSVCVSAKPFKNYLFISTSPLKFSSSLDLQLANFEYKKGTLDQGIKKKEEEKC